MIDLNMSFQSILADAGYECGELHNVWCRAQFAGIEYSDGDEMENGLLETLKRAGDVGIFSSELANACIDWPSRYHLSGERANILRPFSGQLKREARVLEIGAGCGAITRFLGESGAQVLALEGSLRRAIIARERTRDLANVEVAAERFQDLSLDVEFDFITLVGVLEYASLFSDACEPAIDMLQRTRELLAPHGKLVIAIENKLGLKYFAGVPEDHIGEPMFGIENRYADRGARTYGRKELDALLAAAGFGSRRFMVPMPDYKMPATILSELGLAADVSEFDAGSLASQAVRRDPQLTPTTFNLQRAWHEVAINGLITDLANSFLVEVSSPDNAFQGDDSGILAWHFSTQRKAAFAKETWFVKSGEDIRVRSRALCGGQEGIATGGAVSLSVAADSAYVCGGLLVETIRQVLTRRGWTIIELVSAFSDYLDTLRRVLADESIEGAFASHRDALPGDFLDATPSNLIRDRAGRPTYFDREWSIDSLSLGWLATRGLLFAYAGTPVAQMEAAGSAMDVRTLIVLVLKAVITDYDEAVLDAALQREIAFQLDVTGKNTQAVLEGALASHVPMLEVVPPVANAMGTGADVVSRLDGLQHSLNLSAQHQMNVYASLDAVHAKIDAAGHTDQRVQELLQLQEQFARQILASLNEGYAAQEGEAERVAGIEAGIRSLLEQQSSFQKSLDALQEASQRRWWKRNS